jgi:hypothetical protein
MAAYQSIKQSMSPVVTSEATRSLKIHFSIPVSRPILIQPAAAAGQIIAPATGSTPLQQQVELLQKQQRWLAKQQAPLTKRQWRLAKERERLEQQQQQQQVKSGNGLAISQSAG